MDLRKYYLENVLDTEYYYKFYELIRHPIVIEDVLPWEQETDDYNFRVFDLEEVIEKIKFLCMPENENHSLEDKCWFYACLFFLYKNDYYIEEFPRLITRPPAESYDFVNKDIRQKIVNDGKDDNGTVRYAERRKLVNSLCFKKRNNYSVEIHKDIEDKFREISTRNASFNKMSTDEKIEEISNLIENLLKKEKKFVSLDYSLVCFNYITEELIIDYRKKIQCFRHSSTQSLNERKKFSVKQKEFIIDYGLLILKEIHYLVKK